MDLKQQINEARQAFYAARERLEDLEEEYRKTVEDPEMRAMVGKCFKYRNGYGDGRRWWQYLRVFDVNENTLSMLTVEQDSNGEQFVIQLNTYYPLSRDYLPITDAEYRDAVGPILANIRERAGL